MKRVDQGRMKDVGKLYKTANESTSGHLKK